MTKLFWGHLEYLYQGLVPSAPPGTTLDYENKLNTIVGVLPGIFDTSGDINSNVNNVALNTVGAAATDLATRTTELDNERKLKLEAEAKLLVWENNKAALLAYLKDLKGYKELVSKLTAVHNVAVPTATEKTQLENDIKNIDTIVIEVSGLKAKKDKLKATIQKYLGKYDTLAWKGATEIEKYAGKGNSDFHWGDANRGNGTWENYLDIITKDGSGGYEYYDDVRAGLLMGLHETIVPELLRRYKNEGLKKKELIDYMAETDIYYAGFFTTKSANAKVNTDILDTLDANYKNQTYENIINNLVVKVDWKDKLEDIRNQVGTWNATTTIANVRTWAAAQLTTLKPLDGINLAGASKATLRGLTAGTAVTGAMGKADIWNNYIPLQSDTDGNCFLNAFAILLTGDQTIDKSGATPNSQQNVALRLRVAMCLNLMAKKEWMGNDDLVLSRIGSKYDGWNANVWEIHRKLLKAKYNATTHDDVLEERYDKTTGRYSVNPNYAGATDCSMATNGKWLSNQDISYMSLLLDRPTTVVSKGASATTGGFLSTTFTWETSNLPEFSHAEPMVIWNPTDGHYEPLVQPDDHKEGKFKFNVAAAPVFVKTTPAAATVTFTFGAGADDKLKASLLSGHENTRLATDLATATSLVITLDYDADAAGERAWYDDKEAAFANKSGRRFMVTLCHVDKVNVTANVVNVPYADFIEVDLLPLPKFDGVETLPASITDKDESHEWYINQIKSKIRWFSMDADEKANKDWKAFNVLALDDTAKDWEAEIKKQGTVADTKTYIETTLNLFALVEELNLVNNLKEIKASSLPTAITDLDDAKAWYTSAIIARGFKLEVEVQDGGAKIGDFDAHLGFTARTWIETIDDVTTNLADLKTLIDSKEWIAGLRAVA